MKISHLKEKKHAATVGGAVTILLALIIIVVAQLQIGQSHADTNDIDPHLQFCRTYYNVQDGATNQGSTAKFDSCQALDTQFEGYVQSLAFTYGNSPTSTSTPTPGSTMVSTPTTATTKNWPATNLVALVIPADQGKDISDLPATDVKQVEDALTSYFQSHISTDTEQWAIDQGAISSWLNDPFLQLATVTYSVDPTTGKSTYIGAANSDSTIIPLSNFLQQSSQEIEAVQTDIVNNVKSTSYTDDGANCSFSSSTALSQSYQDCLGTGTIVDAIYAENVKQGDTPSVAYTKAITIVENEYAGPIKQYLQANQTTNSGQKALQAYNTISAITDKKLRDTYIDHILTDIVKGQPAGSIAPQPSSTATATSTSTPSVSATATSTPIPLLQS